MQAVKNVSRITLIPINVLLILLPIGILCLWTLVDTNVMKNFLSIINTKFFINTTRGPVNILQVNWTASSKILALSSHIVGSTPFFLGLLSLKAIFKNYKNGDIFTTVNAKYYKRLGLLFFLTVLITKPVGNIGLALAATLSNPPGHHYLNFEFGFLDIKAMFLGLLIIVISWVMLEASKINEEHLYTV